MDDTEGVDLEPVDEGVFVSKFLVTRLTASMHSASSSSMLALQLYQRLEQGRCKRRRKTHFSLINWELGGARGKRRSKRLDFMKDFSCIERLS